MAIKTGFNNAKGGGGGSETSGCYLLNNASSLTHLYAHTYEGQLINIDNRMSFPLKDADTLIGDDGYCYKLLMIDEDLGTFTCVKFWKLGDLPTIEIDFSQMTSQTTAELTQDQFAIMENNNIFNIIFPDGSKRIFTYGYEFGDMVSYDSYYCDSDIPNNEKLTYIECIVDSTTLIATIKTTQFGKAKQLYQHNIQISGECNNEYVWILLQITSDSPLPFVKHQDYIEGTNQDIHEWLLDNGFDSDDLANMYNCCIENSGTLKLVGIGTKIQSGTYYFTTYNMVSTSSNNITNTTIRGDIVIEL